MSCQDFLTSPIPPKKYLTFLREYEAKYPYMIHGLGIFTYHTSKPNIGNYAITMDSLGGWIHASIYGIHIPWILWDMMPQHIAIRPIRGRFLLQVGGPRTDFSSSFWGWMVTIDILVGLFQKKAVEVEVQLVDEDLITDSEFRVYI